MAESKKDATFNQIAALVVVVVMALGLGWSVGYLMAANHYIESVQQRVFMVVPPQSAGFSNYAKGTIEYPRPTRELKGDREDVNDSR